MEDMWEVGVGWKWDLFANLLPCIILRNIAVLKLVEMRNAETYDIGKALHGETFLSSMPWTLCEMTCLPDQAKSGSLRGEPQFNKGFGFFLWLLFHERILCNTNRVHRHLAEDPRCSRCNNNSDVTLLHLFRDCLLREPSGLVLGVRPNTRYSIRPTCRLVLPTIYKLI